MEESRLSYEASRSLRRIRPKIDRRIDEAAPSEAGATRLREDVEARLADHWPRLFKLLYQLYGHHYDFFYYLESIALTAIDCWLERPAPLKELDRHRENDPGWYLSEKMVGGSLYVDLFNGNLARLRDVIPYLRDLGLTYLHLMPLFASRPGNSDGGYAISDYRAVDPRLGTIDDLRSLADDLREAGISLVLDFVFNHTADDHLWAIRAQEGEREFIDYYRTFPDRSLPDQYERTLREIFPSVRRGNFTWNETLKRWVWTTFNSFQWDLDYSNPEVFRAMASEMLFLANTGVEILRLDAVAFIWKEMGTSCENLPEAHLIIQAFNALCRIAAPGLVFKSEAIVHPDEVVKYIDAGECQISYNPTFMALLWESMATRETRLLKQSMEHRFQLPPGTTWMNYLRCHDDIGWSFDNGDAWAAGIHPDHHRDFLNRFYTARFPGSFARGVPFQHNEATGDMRICGTMASLAGLEEAVVANDPVLLDMALRRIRMAYGVLCAAAGMPLIFLGEEWGLLNDYSYQLDPDKGDDSRWIHRVRMDWSLPAKKSRKNFVPSLVHRALRQLFSVRKTIPAFRGNRLRLLPIDNGHSLAFARWHDASFAVVVANFSEREQPVDLGAIRSMGLGHFLCDSLTGREISTRAGVLLEPYEILWMQEA
ncbi:MAG: amylosucrase [Puniceicoccaceae bacterium]